MMINTRRDYTQQTSLPPLPLASASRPTSGVPQLLAEDMDIRHDPKKQGGKETDAAAGPTFDSSAAPSPIALHACGSESARLHRERRSSSSLHLCASAFHVSCLSVLGCVRAVEGVCSVCIARLCDLVHA